MPRLKPETQWFPLWSPLHVYVTPCSDQHYKRIEWVVYAEKASASELLEKAENRAKKRVNRAETLAKYDSKSCLQVNDDMTNNGWGMGGHVISCLLGHVSGKRTSLKFESPTLTQI